MNINKGRSPFYPGQPVPIDFFVGRRDEIEKITRSLRQVELGKPQAVFLTGEYGIGKSSLAGFMNNYAGKIHHILGIHVLLGSVKTLDDLSTAVVESVIKSRAYEPTISEKVRGFLTKYVGKQDLFGLTINLEALKTDSPTISHGFLPFLCGLLDRVEREGIKGILLILDEINGISDNPPFAHFIKGLVDENALNKTPLPLFIMLCGVDDRRKEMIRHHQPIERIFDIVEIKPMDDSEMMDFFTKSFDSVDMKIDKEAMTLLCHYSAGFPKIMHIIGDAVFWTNQDNLVDRNDAIVGVGIAAEDIGKKFVDQQVYRALRSKDYHSILSKIVKQRFDLAFSKTIIDKGLSESERRKFHNFLQRMKKLNVLKSGDERGEYIFNSRLVRLYILLNSLASEKK